MVVDCNSAAQRSAATAFKLTGNVLSFGAAGTMLALILLDPYARKQVRPKMMATLAGLDTLAAVLWFMDSCIGFSVSSTSWTQAERLLRVIGNFTTFSSFSWTVVIGESSIC
jgi:hypothetical protein